MKMFRRLYQLHISWLNITAINFKETYTLWTTEFSIQSLKWVDFSLFLITVRLVSSANLPSSGRVEVFYNGTWGTICDDYWDLQDAHVVCRQLGYEGAISAPAYAAFGQGTGPIWLDDVNCVGNETLLAQCRHRGWGIENCGHSEDAGAVCQPSGNSTTCTKYITFVCYKYIFAEGIHDALCIMKLGLSTGLEEECIF